MLMLGTARWTPAIAAGALLLAVAACGGGGAGASAGSASPSSPASSTGAPAAAVSAAPAVPSAVPGDAGNGAASSAGGAGAGNDRCAKFTTAQVTPLTGDAFQTAEPSILDVPGCQWYFSSGAGNVNLQILPGSQYGDWSGKPGATAVSGVGDSAFVGPYVLGGTMAGAQVGGTFYFLTVSPAPSNDVVVAFLKEAIAQAGGS
jgi:hypothetical protein